MGVSAATVASYATIAAAATTVAGTAYSVSQSGGQPKAPHIPTPPPSAHPATAADPNVVAAGAQNKARAAAAGANNSGTQATSPQGLTQPLTTAKSTLLGGTSLS